MRNAEKAGSTTRKSEKTFHKMSKAIGDCLSNLASSNDEQDGEDEEGDKEHTELAKLSEDDVPGWVMGTMSIMVQQTRESFWPKQIRPDELTQL